MKCSISNIANVISESIPNPAESGFDIFVGLEHYDSGEVKVTRYGSTQNLVTAVKVFRKGDILLARRNVYLKRAGLVDFDGVTSGDSIVLRVKDDLSSLSLQSEDIRMCLPFVLNTEEFWNYAEKYSDGTMSKRLSPKTLLQYEFDIPDDVTEKNRLLWQAYKTKESYKAMITATDEMVKSQFIEETKLWENEGTIRDLIHNTVEKAGKKYSADSKIRYIDISSADNETNTVTGVTEYIFKDAPSRAQQCVKKGDILVSTVRPNLKNIAVNHLDGEDLVASSGFCVLRPKEGCAGLIMAYILSDVFTEKMTLVAKGTNYPAIHDSDILDYKIRLPEDSKVSMIDRLFRQADKSKFELKQAIEKIDKVMRALMQ